METLPSKLLDNAVNEFAKLPGIGQKTALRLALYLLKQSTEDVTNFGNTFIEMKKNIKHCKVCYNISDNEVCEICAHPLRNPQLVCVVENIRDVMAIEKTAQYQGLYHVLGGIISPMDGVGPDDLTIKELINRVENESIKEIILALSTTMEGDTTNFYLFKKLKKYPVEISILARGVSIGDELEYADEITLGRSIVNRTPYQG